MVYESDFYTVRRPYSRPTITSYSVTSPRHYVVTDTPERSRRAEEQYSYSYNSNTETSRRGSGPPSRHYSSSSETVNRSTSGGPGAYSYSTERSSRSSDYPGSYHSSYSSTTSGRLPHGTTYRHFSYRAPRISVTTWRVKPSIRTSVLIGELDRIHHRSRPHLAYVPTEDFLNSRPLVDFDDETKIIRAETERLMKRIYTSVPHPRSTTPLQIVPYYGHRASDKYNSHRHNTVSDEIFNMSHYNEPSARTIGTISKKIYHLLFYKEHLACVSFAGGRGYPRRKHLYLDENRDIQDEIKFRSYYYKNIAYEEAMSLPTGFASYLLRLQPDNRNGTLTSSEKLHITNILKERKSKNSAGEIKEPAAAAKNGAPEKKTSTYKSQNANETVIPIERETKPYKYKPKDPKPYENHVSEINGTINVTNTHILEEPQRKLSEPKIITEPIPIVQPIEKIIEINVEPKVRKENIKSSRKTSKIKIQSEEKEVKVKIQPKTQDDEKQKQATGNETIIEPEKVQEEKPHIQELNLSETTEVVKQETETDFLTESVINESKNELNTETIKDDFTATETPIVTQSSTAIDTEIATESPIVTDTQIVTESSIAKESQIIKNTPIATESSIISEPPIATEEETVHVDNKESNIKNTEENLLDSTINKTTEEIDVLEQDLNKTTIENVLEIVDKKKDDNILTTENEISSDIEQRITETPEETVFQTRQVIVSSTVQETTEVVVTSSQIEIENTQQDSIIGQVIPSHDEKITTEDTQVTRQTEAVSNQEKAEESTNTKEISSEDLLNRLNTEVFADHNIPREKIIEIEIERPDDLKHIIEEVTDLRSHDVQRESDTEPLIEEPQSPESELIYNKTTNEICEVLSDVAEEA
nr:uncharacterized protein CG45076-like [Halyomorpha halys]